MAATERNPSQTSVPSAQQIEAKRLIQWHQAGEPLLTVDALKTWLQQAGIVLFTPRPQQLPAPAPSFVEATLGVPTPAPTLEQVEKARVLLARLVSEGSAVALNLTGTAGETPDYVVATAILPYVFTLRGDKGWKVAPTTDGAVRISPLALGIYEALVAKGQLSASDLAQEVGREVTEGAVIRSLGELWQSLRVLPVYGREASDATQWELASSRFTRQLKAGANAGQPTALSALISLYMDQALLPTGDEVEVFLSPLAPRSRIREVVSALTGSRQVDSVVVDGKALLCVAGSLPSFVEATAAAASEEDSAEGHESVALSDAADPTIRRYSGGSADGRAPRPFDSRSGSGADRRAVGFGARPITRDRRPFDRSRSNGPAPGERPDFTKPWDEERAARGDRPRPEPAGDRPFVPRAPREGGFAARGGDRDRRPYAPRPSGDRPYSPRPSGDRPFTPRPSGDRPFRPSGDRDSRPPRVGGFDRPRPSFGGGRPTPRRFDAPQGGEANGERPFRPAPRGDRPSFGDRKPSFGARPSFGGDRPARPFTPREGGDGERKPFRKFDGPRPEGGSRPPFRKFDGPRPEGGRPFTPREGGDGERKPFRKFDAPSGDRPAFRKFDGPRPEGGSRPPFRKFDDRPARPFTPREGGDGERKPFRKFDGSRPEGGRPSFGDRKPSFGGKPSFGDRPKRPFTPREGGDRPAFGDRKPSFGARPGSGGPRAAGAGGRPSFSGKPSFGGKPGFAGKSFGKPRPSGPRSDAPRRRPDQE